MESVENSLSLLGVLGFLGKSVIKEDIASFALNITNSISRDVGHLDEVSVGAFS